MDMIITALKIFAEVVMEENMKINMVKKDLENFDVTQQDTIFQKVTITVSNGSAVFTVPPSVVGYQVVSYKQTLPETDNAISIAPSGFLLPGAYVERYITYNSVQNTFNHYVSITFTSNTSGDNKTYTIPVQSINVNEYYHLEVTND